MPKKPALPYNADDVKQWPTSKLLITLHQLVLVCSVQDPTWPSRFLVDVFGTRKVEIDEFEFTSERPRLTGDVSGDEIDAFMKLVSTEVDARIPPRGN